MLEHLSSLIHRHHVDQNIDQVKHTIEQAKTENKWSANDILVLNAVREAIQLKDKRIVELFLDEKVDPNACVPLKENEYSTRPLIYFAAEVESLEMVKFLKKRGALVTDKKDYFTIDNQDALRIAIEKGNTAIVKYLLKSGGNPNGCMERHKTDLFPYLATPFLSKAAIEGQIDILNLLLQHGADMATALAATYYRYNRIVERLNKYERLRPDSKQKKNFEIYCQSIKLLLSFAQGVDLGSKETSDWIDDTKDAGLQVNSALFIFKHVNVEEWSFVGVSVGGKPVTNQMLIEAGIQGADQALCVLSDLDALDPETRIPLQERIDIVCRVKGGVIDDEGVVHVVPLQAAVACGDVKAVKARLTHGENPNQRFDNKKFSFSIMEHAAEKGFIDIVKLLAEHPAIDHRSIVRASWIAKNHQFTEMSDFLQTFLTVDDWDEDGNAPIHNAVYNGDVEGVKRLIEKGANLTSKDARGRSTIQLAIVGFGKCGYLQRKRPEYIEILSLLLDQGVDPNVDTSTRDYHGNVDKSALELAIEINFLEAIQLLLPRTTKKPIEAPGPFH